MADHHASTGSAAAHGQKTDLLFQIGALLGSILIVHTVYLLSIRPSASLQVAEAAAINQAPERTLFIILKDYEQEICLILMLWAVCIIGRKIAESLRHRHFLDVDLIDRQGTQEVTQATARSALQQLWDLGRPALDAVVVQSLIAGLQRFIATGSIQNASHAVAEYTDAVAARLDTELSMVRYIIWAIPSVGFIGTVRGIGDALSQAHIALEGDIAGMTASLGVAFNSTLVALLISIVLMFLLHQLQLIQDKSVLDAQDYCDQMFLKHLIED
jgi:biopolymer transport protein ExbB/TolQ